MNNLSVRETGSIAVPSDGPKRSTQEIARRATELEIIADVSAAISSELELDTVMQTVVDLTKSSFGLYHAHVYLIDESREYLVLAAGADFAGRQMVAAGHRIQYNRVQSIVATAARQRQAVTVNDVTLEPNFLPNPFLPDTRSEIALPLIVGDELIGVLDFQSEVVGRFGTEDIRVKTILAQQIAISVRNARAYSAQKRQLAQQEVNIAISNLLRRSTHSIADLLDEIMLAMNQVFHADHLLNVSYDPETDTWNGVTAVGAQFTREQIQQINAPGPHYAHAIEAITRNEHVVVRRANSFANFPTEFLEAPFSVTSALVIPITTERTFSVILVHYTNSYHDFNNDEINFARLIGSQLAEGLERRYSELALERASERAALLASVSHQLAQSVDELSVMEALKPVSSMIEAQQTYLIYLHTQNDETEPVASVVGFITADGAAHAIEQPAFNLDEMPMLRFLPSEKGRMLFMGDLLTDPHFKDQESVRAFVTQNQMRATAILPLRAAEQLTGVVAFGWNAPQMINAEHRSVLEPIMAPLSTIVASIQAKKAEAKAYQSAQKLARNLAVVAEVGNSITNILDIDTLLHTVVELTKERFNLYHTHIYLLDNEQKWLVMAAGAGDAGKVMKERKHRISAENPVSLVARAARERTSIYINDVASSPTFMPNPLLPETRAEHSVPIIIGGRVLGVFDLQSDRLNYFDEIDAQAMVALTDQIAVGIENARAFTGLKTAEAQVKRRATELEMVAKVSTAVASMLDLQQLLKSVVELTKSSFNLYHAHVYLMDENREYLMLAAGAGVAGEIMEDAGHRIALQRPNSLVARAARTGLGVVTNDVTAEPDFLPNPLLPDTLSELAVPLILGNEVIGVLDVQSDIKDRFSDEDVNVKTALAAQIAVAVQNARAVQRLLLTERAIENSASGLTIVDARKPNKPIIYANPALETMSGYTAEELVGQNYLILTGSDQEQEALSSIEAALSAGQSSRAVLRNYRKDGTLFYNSIRIAPIQDAQQQITHYVAVQTDITAQRELETQREIMLARAEEQAQLERQTAQSLREADRMKSQFLANMSHELRTPLNSIIGYSEVLLDGDDGELSEEAVEDIQTIHDSGRHLLSIINEILDLSKIEAGQMTLDKRPIELPKIANEVLDAAQVLVRDKGITLQLVEEAPIPPLHADMVRLRQILNNLMSNAIKFTEKGGVALCYGMADKQTAYIEVRDTGIGMSAEDLKVIFQQFRQVDGSSTRRAGGTGLGLTITKALVEMHNGQISVTSAVGKGTTFRVVLPLYLVNEVA